MSAILDYTRVALRVEPFALEPSWIIECVPIPVDWSQRLQTFVDGWKSERTATDEYLGDKPFSEFVLTERASSWDEFLQWANELKGGWCFRGQSDSEWLLHTTLDRAVKKGWSAENRSGYYHLDREFEGRELLFRFQQQAHQYLGNLPAGDDLGSWFALMQHYGVPTRLLDWTQSPSVGMYFAIEYEAQKGSLSALWAIDLDWLERRGRELSKSREAWAEDSKLRADYANTLLCDKDEPIIIRINPHMADERMLAQQGLFLCKLVHRATFNQILMTMMIHPSVPSLPVVRKLDVEKKLRIEFLRNLREMNIHRGSLFPGLDGFGRSLRIDLEIKVADAPT